MTAQERLNVALMLPKCRLNVASLLLSSCFCVASLCFNIASHCFALSCIALHCFIVFCICTICALFRVWVCLNCVLLVLVVSWLRIGFILRDGCFMLTSSLCFGCA